MPRLERRPKAVRTSLSSEQWCELIQGPDYPFHDFTSRFETPLAKRAAWIQNREAILAAFAQMHGPVARPECWWTFDSPREPRRVVGRRAPDPSAIPTDIRFNGQPIMESDLAFLERHSLLTPIGIAHLAELREGDQREHPDALGACTMRKQDWEAYERAATDAA